MLPAQVYIEKLNSSINTDLYDEICPVLSLDDQTLYFTRVGDPEFVKTLIHYNKDQYSHLSKEEYLKFLSRVYSTIAGRKVNSPVSSEFNQDIWMAKSKDDLFDQVTHPGAPLNNALPNSVCSIFPERNALIIVNQFGEEGGMYEGFSYSELDGGKFKFPQDLNIHEFYESGTGVNLSMSHDANHLFMSLERDDSNGQHDLYLSIRVYEDLWSYPFLIKTGINTIHDETTPFISKDKKRLYFASDRPGSEGGVDLYVANRLDYSYMNWSEPKKLNIPINTKADESQPFLDKKEEYLYFTSNRDGTSDIFRVKLEPSVELSEPIIVNLTIIDAKTNKPTRGELRWGPSFKDGFSSFFRTYNGKHQIEITKDEPLRIQAKKRGYVSEEVLISPRKLLADNISIYDVEIYIHKGKKIKKRKDLLLFGKKRKITLDNIYFEQSKDVVLPQSFLQLKMLARVLAENPEIYISIEGHTDNQGDPDDNQLLSENRARAIKQYLVGQLINPVRITTIGMGSSKPLNNNETEKDRKKNRRVELRIIKE